MSSFFQNEGLWLKGNLHLHSSLSDGKNPPNELFKMYKEAGYNFTALTDHWNLTKEVQENDFLVIPGVEINSQFDGNQLIHLVALELKSIPPVRNGKGLYKHVIENSSYVHLAHPYWSMLELESVPFLGQVDAVEVFNTGCEMEIGRGFSEYFIDLALSKGIKTKIVAVDDSHQRLVDYCKSFVMVKAKENTAKNIIEALKKGEYYSSNGPLIEDIELKENKVYVKTSPCKEIRFICNLWFGANILSGTLNGITEAEFTLRNEIQYIRVEAVDYNGNKAWSNPIWIV